MFLCWHLFFDLLHHLPNNLWEEQSCDQRIFDAVALDVVYVAELLAHDHNHRNEAEVAEPSNAH